MRKFLRRAITTLDYCELRSSDYLAAAAQFALAVNWNPKQEGLDYNLGLAYYKSGLYPQAISPLENQFKVHPENIQIRVLLGMSYFMVEKYSQASELLAALIDSTPADANTYYGLASSLIKQSKTDSLDRVLAQMKAATGDSPQLHLILAEKYLTKGDRSGTLSELALTAKLNRNVPGVHYHTAMLHLKLGRVDDAIREFDAELAVSPNDINTKYRLATYITCQ